MTGRTTVRLPGELLKRARLKAVAQGRTLTSLIEEGLRLVISDEKGRPRKTHNNAPVSAATGGLMPGVELDDFAALQEADDREYLDRFNRFK